MYQIHYRYSNDSEEYEKYSGVYEEEKEEVDIDIIIKYGDYK